MYAAFQDRHTMIERVYIHKVETGYQAFFISQKTAFHLPMDAGAGAGAEALTDPGIGGGEGGGAGGGLGGYCKLVHSARTYGHVVTRRSFFLTFAVRLDETKT